MPLAATLIAQPPSRVIVVEPGEWRLIGDFEHVCAAHGVPLVIREDRHFLCSSEDFTGWMARRRQPRMEHFYRWLRQKTGVLMRDDKPEGGAWNYDHDNRESFDARGPGLVPKPIAFAPDAITREVLTLVARDYAGHPGALGELRLAGDARRRAACACRFHRASPAGLRALPGCALDREPLLYHARLSSSLNLKLLHPREVIDAAVQATSPGARRWPVSRVSCARFSAGASSCAACTGSTCRSISTTTRSPPSSRCLRSTGPATPR